MGPGLALSPAHRSGTPYNNCEQVFRERDWRPRHNSVMLAAAPYRSNREAGHKIASTQHVLVLMLWQRSASRLYVERISVTGVVVLTGSATG